VGLLRRIGSLTRSMKDRTMGRPQKPVSDMTDEELEDELLARRRARAARHGVDLGPTPPRSQERSSASVSTARSRARSPQEQQIAQYYANLELKPGATLDEVRQAYRGMMRRYHPDKHLGDPERHKAATELAQSLTKAYQALVDHLGKQQSSRR